MVFFLLLVSTDTYSIDFHIGSSWQISVELNWMSFTPLPITLAFRSTQVTPDLEGPQVLCSSPWALLTSIYPCHTCTLNLSMFHFRGYTTGGTRWINQTSTRKWIIPQANGIRYIQLMKEAVKEPGFSGNFKFCEKLVASYFQVGRAPATLMTHHRSFRLDVRFEWQSKLSVA